MIVLKKTNEKALADYGEEEGNGPFDRDSPIYI